MSPSPLAPTVPSTDTPAPLLPPSAPTRVEYEDPLELRQQPELGEAHEAVQTLPLTAHRFVRMSHLVWGGPNQ